MKKMMLTLVFVFAIGSFTQINASTNEVMRKDCAEIAFDLQGDLEDNGVDKETANEVATLVYEICEAN